MSAVSVCVCVRDKDHTADVDKTKLSCLVRVGGVNTTADKTRQFCLVSTQFPISKFSVILNIFDTEQLQSGNWVETRQNCLVLSASVFTPQTWTRQQSCLIRVGGVNKLLMLLPRLAVMRCVMN